MYCLYIIAISSVDFCNTSKLFWCVGDLLVPVASPAMGHWSTCHSRLLNLRANYPSTV